MAKFMMSKNAARNAIEYSEDASTCLMENVRVMDNNVNSYFNGLQDPSLKRYLELSEEMQNVLRQICGKMDEISQYCKSIIRWIDAYSEI